MTKPKRKRKPREWVLVLYRGEFWSIHDTMEHARYAWMDSKEYQYVRVREVTK